MFTLDLKPEEMAVMEKLATELLGTEDMKALVTFFTTDYDMMSEGKFVMGIFLFPTLLNCNLVRILNDDTLLS